MPSLKGRDDSIPLMWGTPQKKAEATIKQALTQAPALRLPDPEKEFQRRETWVQSLGWEDPLEKEMATHSSILAWKIP